MVSNFFAILLGNLLSTVSDWSLPQQQATMCRYTTPVDIVINTGELESSTQFRPFYRKESARSWLIVHGHIAGWLARHVPGNSPCMQNETLGGESFC